MGVMQDSVLSGSATAAIKRMEVVELENWQPVVVLHSAGVFLCMCDLKQHEY